MMLRSTYFLTVPFVAASGIALMVFREPRLHRSEAPEPLRSQIKATYRTLLERGQLRAIVVLTVLTGVLLQVLFEFGPVWLVALAVPAVLYGPHWSGLTLALPSWLTAVCQEVAFSRLTQAATVKLLVVSAVRPLVVATKPLVDPFSHSASPCRPAFHAAAGPRATVPS